MMQRIAWAAVAVLLTLLGPPPSATLAREARPSAKEGVIEPQANQLLRKMSDYLTGLKSFRVHASTIDEKVTTEGQKIQELKESDVTLVRPNHLRVDRLGPYGRVTLRYDGHQFSIVAEEKRAYATEPAPAVLESAIDHARVKLGVDAPGGDLLVPDPYKPLLDGMITGRYLGRQPIGDGWAHHLAFTKEEVDWQIWIKDGPEPVPLRYVITTKGMPGRPQFTVELSNWQTDVSVPDEFFAFTPPKGYRKVPFTAPAKAKVEK